MHDMTPVYRQAPADDSEFQPNNFELFISNHNDGWYITNKLVFDCNKVYLCFIENFSSVTDPISLHVPYWAKSPSNNVLFLYKHNPVM